MVFVLPPKSQVGTLPRDFENGSRNAYEDGVSWTPPPVKPAVPDMSQIKTLQRYFNRQGGPNFPAWLYNIETGEERIAENANDAAELGVCYRDPTEEEKERYGDKKVWDWKDDSPWRPTKAKKHIKPQVGGLGKNLVHPDRPQAPAMEATIAAVVAAVTEKMKPSIEGFSAEDMAAIKEFLALKKADPMAKPEKASDGNALSARETSEDQEREIWIEEAEQRGVKIDKRWTTEKIKETVAKAA